MKHINFNLKLAVVCAVVSTLALAGVIIFRIISPQPNSVSPSTAAIPQTSVPRTIGQWTEGVPWAELSANQRLALAPLNGEWNALDASRKQKWLRIANRYTSMTPHQQQRAQKRMQDWVNLSPEQRALARENYARTAKIGADEKTHQWTKYQALPDEQKRKLAAISPKRHVTNIPASPEHSVDVIPAFKSGIQPGKSLTAQAGATSAPTNDAPSVSQERLNSDPP